MRKLLFTSIFLFVFQLAFSENWKVQTGNWNIENNSIKPIKQPDTKFPEFSIFNSATNTETNWKSLSVDFKLTSTISTEQFGLILNANDKSDFQTLRILNFQNNAVLQLFRWQYGQYRLWFEQKARYHFSKDSVYNLSIVRAPLVDKEDWRQWKIIIKNAANIIVFKQGIENEQPAFGIGKVGLYSNTNQLIFSNFQIELDNKSVGMLHLAPLFSNGMVLQAQKPIVIWGKSAPKAKVFVSFKNKAYQAISDSTGNWKIILPALQYQSDLKLKFKSLNDSVLIEEVAVGEVWLASGQSNMEMRTWQTDVAKSKLKFDNKIPIRFFLQPQIPSETPRFDTGGYWANADSISSVMGWSAVALSFAQQLNKSLHVPIGIISSSWGGTAIESWIKANEFQTDSLTKPIIEKYLNDEKQLKQSKTLATTSWNTPGQRHSPSYLYNGMIYPHIPFAIQGVIWYQGESNTYNPKQYERLFPMLINSWRKDFKNEKLPFYFVQLASYDGRQSGNEIPEAWSNLREAQRLTLMTAKNTGMVVATDLGDSLDIHPYRKLEIGNRFSRLAVVDVYKRNEIVRSSPIFQSASYSSEFVVVRFNETGGGLKIQRGNEIIGFSIAGSDMKFVPAKAEFLNDKKSIKVYSNQLKKPVAVRYGWENYPIKSNLVNSDNLPATPFSNIKSTNR